jgi:ABC-type branched-chain amino acid transport system, permease component
MSSMAKGTVSARAETRGMLGRDISADDERRYRAESRLLRTRGQQVMALVIAVAAIGAPFAFAADVDLPYNFPWSSWLNTINQALVALIAAAAFNLLLGYTHQVSVAHAAILMLGACTGGYLGAVHGWPFPIVLVAAFVAGVLLGVVVGTPALRLTGLYLMIATLGLHFIALFLYRKFLVAQFGFAPMVLPAPQIPGWLAPLFGGDFGESMRVRGDDVWYWILLPLAVVSMLVMVNVLRSREGRAFRAVGERDVSAALIGINVTLTKLRAFALSSGFVAFAGALGSYYIGARGEDSFPFTLVLNYAIMIIVGGLGSMRGAVFGVFFFYSVRDILGWALKSLPGLNSVGLLQRYPAELNLALFGVLIIVVLILRPDGLDGIYLALKRWLTGQWQRWRGRTS